MSKITNRRSTKNTQTSCLRRFAVGYTRVSTPRQGDKGTSLETQRIAIEAFAQAMDFTLIETFDDVASGYGAKSLYNRKKLQAALDLVARNDAVLIVWDWDRLSRHASFDMQVKEILPDASRVICAKDGMNMLEASRAAQLAHGEKAREIISHNTKQGMARMSAQGMKFGNPAIATDVQPLGTLAWSNTREDQDHALADVLRRLPNQLELTRTQAAEIFNQNGLRTLHKKEWTRNRVTEPLRRARVILREEEAAQMSSNPNFGLF